MSADLQSFDQKSREWTELEALNGRMSGAGPKRLSGPELLRYIKLYRRAASDLAALSSSGANPEIASWLNVLVASAYGNIYRTPRRSPGESLLRSLWIAADTVRRRRGYVLLSIGLFLLFGFVAGGFSAANSDIKEILIPPAFQSAVEHWTSGRHPDRSGGESLMATAGYSQNNPMVAISSNALSVGTAGIFGLYSLWMNAAIMGVLTVEVAKAGHLPFFLISIFPHGVSELGGIFVATGAGFLVASAIIAPGRKTRVLAVRLAGRDAAVMLAISLVMIFIAAPIEGYFSFNPNVPLWMKLIFGITALIGWLSYFSFFGKSGPPKGFTEEELRPPTVAD